MDCMKLFDGLHEDVDRLYECGYFERVITSKNDIVSREPLPLRGKKKRTRERLQEK